MIFLQILYPYGIKQLKEIIVLKNSPVRDLIFVENKIVNYQSPVGM